MTAAARASAGGARPRTARGATGRVGPNAVIQLGHALRARAGEARAREVYAAAGVPAMLDAPPEAMVDEGVVVALFGALHARLPSEEARALAAEAGARTAAYLLAKRIPRPVQGLLRLLPARLSARLLLRAVAANAWTFAGSGAFRARAGGARAGAPHVLEIAENPIAAPGCTWHAAVFEGLFRALVAPRAVVRHTACGLDGAPACRFEVLHDAPQEAGAPLAP